MGVYSFEKQIDAESRRKYPFSCFLFAAPEEYADENNKIWAKN